MPKKTFEAAETAQTHLIVQLKDNQPSLRQTVEAACTAAKPVGTVHTTVDKKRRNRHETRITAIFDVSSALAGTEWHTHVAAAIRVERKVLAFQPATGLWKTSVETSFYLSSRPIGAQTAADAIRKHWRTENTQHYTRDVTFGEDASRIRKNPSIFARFRSFALNILRINHQSGSIAQDRYAAALDGLKGIFKMRFF